MTFGEKNQQYVFRMDFRRKSFKNWGKRWFATWTGPGGGGPLFCEAGCDCSTKWRFRYLRLAQMSTLSVQAHTWCPGVLVKFEDDDLPRWRTIFFFDSQKISFNNSLYYFEIFSNNFSSPSFQNAASVFSADNT